MLQSEEFTSEPCEAFFVQENFQRLEGGDKNVDPHVEFVAVNEQRILDVLLDDVGVVWVDLCEVPDDEDASATRAGGWLDDVYRVFVPLTFLDAEGREIGVVFWHDESFGSDVEILLVEGAAVHESVDGLLEVVLPGYV